MRTIALRFSDNFAPNCGTINAHKKIIEEKGYVWYGKLGSAVSKKVIDEILQNEYSKVLLIHSGKTYRYWAFIKEIQHSTPEINAIPEYYREISGRFNTWFKVVKFEEAPKNVLSNCIVSSSKRPLSEVSKCSMSPYFIIDVEDLL